MALPQTNDAAMLRAEVEMLMNERESLLRTLGAASVFFANLTAEDLPETAYDAADVLAKCLDNLPEETLREALLLVQPLVERDLGYAESQPV
ncbi:MAG: hypothetical protein GC151_17255 [Betaproteobacteria bacterium]|nr:hypothetical protein [Betaproteobacteria bacterium]